MKCRFCVKECGNEWCVTKTDDYFVDWIAEILLDVPEEKRMLVLHKVMEKVSSIYGQQGGVDRRD